jgi:hypothetical protein
LAAFLLEKNSNVFTSHDGRSDYSQVLRANEIPQREILLAMAHLARIIHS